MFVSRIPNDGRPTTKWNQWVTRTSVRFEPSTWTSPIPESISTCVTRSVTRT